MSTIQVESYGRHRNKVHLCTVNRFDFLRSGALASTFLIGPFRQTQTLADKKLWVISDRHKSWNLRQILTNKGANLGRHRKSEITGAGILRQTQKRCIGAQ